MKPDARQWLLAIVVAAIILSFLWILRQVTDAQAATCTTTPTEVVCTVNEGESVTSNLTQVEEAEQRWEEQYIPLTDTPTEDAEFTAEQPEQEPQSNATSVNNSPNPGPLPAGTPNGAQQSPMVRSVPRTGTRCPRHGNHPPTHHRHRLHHTQKPVPVPSQRPQLTKLPRHHLRVLRKVPSPGCPHR